MLQAIPFQLKFKKPFHIAHGVRTHTDTVYVKYTHQHITGWGEAALPPYLIENIASVIGFVENFHVIPFTSLAELKQQLHTLQ